MDLYLNQKTENNLEDIFNYSYQKWRDGKIEKKPTRAKIVRKLINDLHEVMVEDGQL